MSELKRPKNKFEYDPTFRINRITSGGAINQDGCEVSGGRLVMVNHHLSQFIALLHSTPRQTRCGLEAQYARSTWNVEIDADEPVVIEDIIHKYKSDSEKILVDDYNTVFVVARGLDTRTIYTAEVPYYMSNHAVWGFKLVRTELFNKLHIGYIINTKDKVLAHGPSLQPNGDWAFGHEVNCTYYGTFNTNEDGCSAGLSVKDLYRSESYNVTEIFVESNQTLTNKHGTDDYYKPIPSVGDKLNAKGLIAVKRDIRKAYALTNLTKSALRSTLRPFDMEIHAMPFSEVIEVEVISGPRAVVDDMPEGFVNYMNALVSNRRNHLKRFRELDRMYTAQAIDSGLSDYLRHPTTQIPMVVSERELGKGKTKPSIIINETVCSGYYIRIVTRKINVPQLGHKYTGLSGEKFVICEFKKDEDMPTDKWGRTSMFNANPVGVVNRNNPSQLFQIYTTDACWHTRAKLREMSENNATWNELWDYLYGFYTVVSPSTTKLIDEHLTVEERPAHIMHCMDYRIDLEDEIGDEFLGVELIGRLVNSVYRPPRDVVKFRDAVGNIQTSKYKCRVSNKYIFALEKIGKHASASSIPLRQNCGFAAKQSSQQKRIAQISSKPARVYGESEFRALVANCGPELARRLITLLSNPRASKLMADEALSHLGFMNIEDLEYRSLGISVLRHLLSCFGFDLEYTPDITEELRVLDMQELGEEL